MRKGTNRARPAGHARATAAAPAQLPLRNRFAIASSRWRYLGTLGRKAFRSQDRAADIYRDNQHVLSAPDLLPIGAELVINIPAESSRSWRTRLSVAPAARLFVPLNAADLAALRSRRRRNWTAPLWRATLCSVLPFRRLAASQKNPPLRSPPFRAPKPEGLWHASYTQVHP